MKLFELQRHIIPSLEKNNIVLEDRSVDTNCAYAAVQEAPRINVNPVDLFIKLFKELYPKAIVQKHPKEEAYLLKLGNYKFFYSPNKGTVTMPTDDDQPRFFDDNQFFENLPKIEEFIGYMNTYTPRNRRKFRF